MKTRAALLVLLLVLPACAGSPRQIEQDYDQARQAMWRGDLPRAQTLADKGAARHLAESEPLWHWRFRLLSCEVAILRRDFPAAEGILEERLPADGTFDGLRARQRLLDAKLDVERGRFRSAHEKLAQARSLDNRDSEVRLDIDRLDGQALLRLGEWNEGDALLKDVLSKATDGADRYHQALALNDLGMSRMVRSRYDEALGYFERVVAMPDLSDQTIYAVSLNNAGSCYQRLGQFDRAIALQQRAFDVHERRGKREYTCRRWARWAISTCCAASRTVRFRSWNAGSMKREPRISRPRRRGWPAIWRARRSNWSAGTRPSATTRRRSGCGSPRIRRPRSITS